MFFLVNVNENDYSIIFGSILGIARNRFSKISFFSFSPTKINVFVHTGFSIVSIRGLCWVAGAALASTRPLMDFFQHEFRVFGACPTSGKLFVLTGSDVVVMVGRAC